MSQDRKRGLFPCSLDEWGLAEVCSATRTTHDQTRPDQTGDGPPDQRQHAIHPGDIAMLFAHRACMAFIRAERRAGRLIGSVSQALPGLRGQRREETTQYMGSQWSCRAVPLLQL